MIKNDNMPCSVAVLGSTGSVGLQALDVARACGIAVDVISANKSIDKLEAQIREFHPHFCVVSDKNAATALKIAVADTDTKVVGEEALGDVLAASKSPVAVNSVLGEAGLIPTLTVIETGKRLALANKESLVIAGEIVKKRANEKGVEIIPVDSEHSAIFQSLNGENRKNIKKIILTASGGPFYGYTKEALAGVTLNDALAHPTWNMGAKITVDSATLMNKGFEVIEAIHLFDVKPEQISVTVHRESIIHSAVEYIDNAVIAQMGVPDMRLCVQYALSYPERTAGPVKELDLFSVGRLTFARPDTESFPLLPLAFKAVSLGGAVPCVLNAANEVAVGEFLRGGLSFIGIFDTVEHTVDKLSHAAALTSLDDILQSDKEARIYARELIKGLCQEH